MTHLFIEITVQEGEFEHTHKILHTTNCINLEFAVQWYCAHFWGYGERDFNDEWWWWDGIHCGRVECWEIVSDEDFEVLSKYL